RQDRGCRHPARHSVRHASFTGFYLLSQLIRMQVLHGSKAVVTIAAIRSGPPSRSECIATDVDHEGSGSAMLMRTDPFRELDRLTQQVFGNSPGTWSRPTAMPMDAYRVGDEFVGAFDRAGVSPDAIELDVERNVLTVKAERRPNRETDQVEMQVAERPLG